MMAKQHNSESGPVRELVERTIDAQTKVGFVIAGERRYVTDRKLLEALRAEADELDRDAKSVRWWPVADGVRQWENSVGDKDIYLRVSESAQHVEQWADDDDLQEISLAGAGYAVCALTSPDTITQDAAFAGLLAAAKNLLARQSGVIETMEFAAALDRLEDAVRSAKAAQGE